MNRLLAVACAASLMAAAGCSSSGSSGSSNTAGGNGGSGSSAAASGGSGGGNAEPADGVLPTTSPLPMPEAGKRYDNPQPRSALKQGGTLTLPIVEIPPNFNGWSVDGNSIYVSAINYWTMPVLFNYDVSGTPKPNPDYLSSVKLVSKNPEVVQYNINPKAKWNNGKPITWKAIETAWKTQNGQDSAFNPAATDGFSAIKNVKKGSNDKQAVITFKTPTYPYQLAVDMEPPKNLNSKFYKKGWVNKAHNELRAGPYQVSNVSKTQITLTPNPKWWGTKPMLNKIVYKQMEDTASINAFANDQVDATSVSNADRLKQVKDMKGIKIQRGFATSTSVLTIGPNSPLMKQQYVRNALELGTDRQTLAKIRFQGMDWHETPPGSSLQYPWQKTYEDNMKELHYDPAKAKKLMTDNGWKMGSDGYFQKNGKDAAFQFVTFGDDPTQAAMWRAEQQMMKKIGLKMNIDKRKDSQFSDTLTKKNFDVVAMGWSGSDPYGWFWTCQIYCSTSESNFSGLGNKQLDAKLKKPQTVPDIAQAAKMGNEAEAEALKLGGTFPMYNGVVQYAIKKGLANTNAITGTSGFYSVAPQDVGWEK